MSCTAVIVAAGKSERFGGELPKVFAEVAGKPIVQWTLEQFERADCISETVLVVSEEYLSLAAEIVNSSGTEKARRIVAGGATRPMSVRLGLEALSHTTELVAIHDGARPLIAVDDITSVVTTGRKTGAAILATRCTDALKVVTNGFIDRTLPKEVHFLAQTPQVFAYELIRGVHRNADADTLAADDAILVERLGIPVAVVEPRFPNPKITFQQDIVMVGALLQRNTYV